MSAAAIGSSYMEFFVTFIYKAYDWLYSLFDNKIVPNVPNNNWNGSQFNGWNIRPMKENNYLSLAENAKSWYQSPTQIAANNSWSVSWKTLFYLGITIITIATLYSGYVYINDWFTYPNNIDPKGKGPQINIESPNGSINTINKSIITKLGDVLLFNRVRNITDAATYLRDRYLPYMDASQRQVVDEIQITNPHSQKLHQFYPYTTYRPGDTSVRNSID